MKFSLSLLLAGVFFVGTAYAPSKPAAAPVLSDAQKLEAVNKAPGWANLKGDSELPPSDAEKLQAYNAGCGVPQDGKKKAGTKNWSHMMKRCVQNA